MTETISAEAKLESESDADLAEAHLAGVVAGLLKLVAEQERLAKRSEKLGGYLSVGGGLHGLPRAVFDALPTKDGARVHEWERVMDDKPGEPSRRWWSKELPSGVTAYTYEAPVSGSVEAGVVTRVTSRPDVHETLKNVDAKQPGDKDPEIGPGVGV